MNNTIKKYLSISEDLIKLYKEKHQLKSALTHKEFEIKKKEIELHSCNIKPFEIIPIPVRLGDLLQELANMYNININTINVTLTANLNTTPDNISTYKTITLYGEKFNWYSTEPSIRIWSRDNFDIYFNLPTNSIDLTKPFPSGKTLIEKTLSSYDYNYGEDGEIKSVFARMEKCTKVLQDIPLYFTLCSLMSSQSNMFSNTNIQDTKNLNKLKQAILNCLNVDYEIPDKQLTHLK